MPKKTNPKTKYLRVRFDTWKTIFDLAKIERRPMIEQAAILIEKAAECKAENTGQPPTQPA
jgi:hypothetical protein